MSLSGTESVTIIRRTLGAEDEYGLNQFTTTEIVIDKVLVGFGSTSQPVVVDAKPQDVSVTLYFPHGTVIMPEDEFIIRGSRWVKDGRVMDWVAPFGSFSPGVVVNVRQTLG
jgi:hypothetical protein